MGLLTLYATIGGITSAALLAVTRLLALLSARPSCEHSRRCSTADTSPVHAGEDRFLLDNGHLVSSPTEDSPSGLGRTIGNRVGVDSPSRVQIPYPPHLTRRNAGHP